MTFSSSSYHLKVASQMNRWTRATRSDLSCSLNIIAIKFVSQIIRYVSEDLNKSIGGKSLSV